MFYIVVYGSNHVGAKDRVLLWWTVFLVLSCIASVGCIIAQVREYIKQLRHRRQEVSLQSASTLLSRYMKHKQQLLTVQREIRLTYVTLALATIEVLLETP